MIRLIIFAALLGLGWYAYQSLKSLPPAQKRKMLWRIALGALVGVALLAVLTGRLHWLGGVIAVLLAGLKFGAHALFRLWPLLRATGKDAVFRTEFLEVRFLVRSSQLRGKVIAGPHEGEDLQSLPADTLRELADFYRDRDKRSYYLVTVFLQRAGADRAEYQDSGSKETGGFSSAPSRDEALLILGLSGHPSREEIIAAHRRLIQKLHPDRGGNDYLAARINQAKDILLR